MKKLFVVLALLGAAAVPGTQVQASCTGGASFPMLHGLGSYFACDTSRGDVAMFSYEIDNPMAVSWGTVANPFATIAPGQVQVSTNWANDGITGCPNDATGFAGTGDHRVVIMVQDNTGAGLIASISGADPGAGYLVETAHKSNPADPTFSFPLPCGTTAGKPTVTGSTATSVSIHVANPVVYTDCDPDSVGMDPINALTTCPDNFHPTAAIGGIYTSVQACGTRPNLNRSAAAPLNWTKSAILPDATGNATLLQLVRPTSNVCNNAPGNPPGANLGGTVCTSDANCGGLPGACQPACLYIGTTVNIPYSFFTQVSSESGAISGFVQVGGQLAAPTKVLDLRATKGQGKVTIDFRTDTQVGLGALEVSTSGPKGLTKIGTVALKSGEAGASYSASFPMSDFKGNKTIVVSARDVNGNVTSTAKASF